MDKYVDKAGLQDFATKMNAKQKTIFALKSEVGSPLVAATAADMTDTDKVYVYTGSEAGYTAGNWYYYDGSVWQSGGVYNAIAFTTDTTLSNPGEAADAKVTGDDIRALQSDMANKANKDGSYDTMNVGTAENLTPYSASAGVEQAIPFILQGTGCGNGETQVDTGSFCQLKEKRGNSVVVNQLRTNTSGSASSSTAYGVFGSEQPPLVYGHIYYVSFAVKEASDNVDTMPYFFKMGHTGYSHFTILISSSSEWTTYRKIAPLTLSGGTENNVAGFQKGNNVDKKSIEYKDLHIVDLTQWFGSNDKIPTYLLNHPEDFGRYYQGSPAYNAGTLVNADGGVLKTIGRNQWNEQWELGGINNTTGEDSESSSNIRTVGYTKIIPNTQYYVYTQTTIGFRYYDAQKNYIGSAAVLNGSTPTTPANAHFLRFVITGVTAYGNNITISLYYSGESGYDEYYPYEELASIDTGSETLRSAGNAYDVKTPDGTITRDIGYVDLGSLDWVYAPSTFSKPCFQSSNLSNCKFNMAYSPVGLCAKYNIVPFSVNTNKTGQFTNSGKIYIVDESYSDPDVFKTAMSGVYLYYELATPTTEQGTPFAETVPVDDFGSMQFVNTNGVPQGNLIFYPVDYKAFVDTAYNELDGDATQIAQKGELAVGDPDTIKGVLNLINAKIPAPPASDGAYKLTVTVSSGVATYSWEA